LISSDLSTIGRGAGVAAARGCAAPLWVGAFSDNVAAKVTLPYAALRVAHRPNSAAMLDAVAALLENSPAGR
jgi:hypothetical protein